MNNGPVQVWTPMSGVTPRVAYMGQFYAIASNELTASSVYAVCVMHKVRRPQGQIEVVYGSCPISAHL